MKFCMPHWNKLRESVEKHGLSQFVSQDVATAAQQFAQETTNGNAETGGAYDPLIRATSMIYLKALEWGGQYMVTAEPEPCPVCEAVKHTAGFDEAYGQDKPVDAAWVENFWIDGPVQAIQTHFRTLGLIPKVQ